MKTIEERAKEYASKKADISLSPVYNDALANLYEEGYIVGASEQKAIDEEVRLKKCDNMTKVEYEREVAFADWYNKNGKGTPTYSDAIEWARRELLDETCTLLREMVECGVHPSNAYGFADRFRKTLEDSYGNENTKEI